jgi:hypothetical protein
MITMGLSVPMKFILRIDDYIVHPTNVYHQKYMVPTPTFALGLISTTFNNNLTIGGKSANGYGITGSGVAIGSGGINPSINTQGLLSTFDSIFLKIVKELPKV